MTYKPEIGRLLVVTDLTTGHSYEQTVESTLGQYVFVGEHRTRFHALDDLKEPGVWQTGGVRFIEEEVNDRYQAELKEEQRKVRRPVSPEKKEKLKLIQAALKPKR